MSERARTGQEPVAAKDLCTIDRRHVMHVYSRLDVGGIELILMRLLPRLNTGRYRVSLCLIKRAGDLAGELRGLGVPVHVVPIRGRFRPGSMFALARLFRRERVSIVHAHVREANASAAVAARLARVPVVIGTVHNVDEIRGRRRALQDRLVDFLRDATVTVSEAVRDNYCRTIGISPAKCVTIYHGLDIEKFTAGGPTRDAVRASLGLAPEARVVITVARLVPQKAHEILIEAAPRILQAVPSVQFLVVGGGPRLEELRELASKRGVGEIFHFLGKRYDTRDLYRAADVSCLISWREGFSIAVVESLASGLPVVASDVGGNREAIEDGVTGYIVPTAEAAAVSDRLSRLLGEDTLRERMSEAARGRAKQFGLDQTARDIEALYDRLLAAGR